VNYVTIVGASIPDMGDPLVQISSDVQLHSPGKHVLILPVQLYFIHLQVLSLQVMVITVVKEEMKVRAGMKVEEEEKVKEEIKVVVGMKVEEEEKVKEEMKVEV
jgi:hypothetical protein